MPASVILVDDHAIVREGLRHLIEVEPDLRVLQGFGDGHAAVAFALVHHPDLAVIDVAMPAMNGIEVARRIHDGCPGTEIVMLSMHADFEYVYQSFRAGARGYVVKDSVGAELVGALRAVRSRRRYLSRRLDAGEFEGYLRNRGPDEPLDRLSARERQVLQLVVEGRTSAEIAATLALSPKSVDTYRSRLMAKLDLDDLPALVKFAIRHGITTVR